MQKTKIILYLHFDKYANRRESEGGFPEILHNLIKASAPPQAFSTFRMPTWDGVRLHGTDGHIIAQDSFYTEFLPIGESYWEMGVGNEPQKKATADYRKRTYTENTKLSDEIRGRSTFVFVTPRSTWEHDKQLSWLEKRKNDGWMGVKIIDANGLEDWLMELPAVASRAAEIMNMAGFTGSISTPTNHWNLIEASGMGRKSLPAQLFLESRDEAIQAINKAFKNTSESQAFFVNSKEDLNDLVSALVKHTEENNPVAGYASRCLYIKDVSAWHEMSLKRGPHVLVADHSLDVPENPDLISVAKSKGHSVIYPVTSFWAKNSLDTVQIKNASARKIEEILRESGFDEHEVKELADVGTLGTFAIRQKYLGNPMNPAYVDWDSAGVHAIAQLFGSWDQDNPEDMAILRKILGNERWGVLKSDIGKPGSPIEKREDIWLYVARGETWSTLANKLLDEDLDVFRGIAEKVLADDDATLEKSSDDRELLAFIDPTKKSKYSHALKSGMSETLALLGARDLSLSGLSHRKAKNTALLVVRTLLKGADWKRWASLDSYLPLLAEAAPDEFLDACEEALHNLDTSPLNEVFSLETSRNTFGKSSYMCGLLWALEVLAWDKDSLSRVGLILADLSKIDPGGSIGNRPFNTLKDIFLPWHVQTTASVKTRVATVKAIIRQQNNIGWKLLLDLLPAHHGGTFGCKKPTWQTFIPSDWTDNVMREEYWEQNSSYVDIALETSRRNIDRVLDLLDRFSDLPDETQGAVLTMVVEEKPPIDNQENLVRVWEILGSTARSHRNFSDATWAMKEERVASIEEVLKKIEPEDPALKWKYLFNQSERDLYVGEGVDYKEHQKKLNELRVTALQEVIEKHGAEFVLDWVGRVSAPNVLGYTYSSIDQHDQIISNMEKMDLSSQENKLFLAGYFGGRRECNDWSWFESVVDRELSIELEKVLILNFPFEKRTWDILEKSGNEDLAEHYWANVGINPYQIGNEWEYVSNNLMKQERYSDLLFVLNETKNRGFADDEYLLQALEKSLSYDEYSENNLPRRHDVLDLIEELQKDRKYNERLFPIEFGYLQYYSNADSHTPITLEEKLSSDGAYFAELIAIAFRSVNDDIEDSNVDPKVSKHVYTLLDMWSQCPGTDLNHGLDVDKFENWIDIVREKTARSGHLDSAMYVVGQVLINAPSDESGMFIDEKIASELDKKESDKMRRAYSTAKYNQRGVHSYTGGEAEVKLFDKYMGCAAEVESKGFVRFATTLRELAETYRSESEYQMKNSPFE